MRVREEGISSVIGIFIESVKLSFKVKDLVK